MVDYTHPARKHAATCTLCALRRAAERQPVSLVKAYV